MAKEPSQKQLDYLSALGYRGIKPRSMTEASILIDEMKESGDSEQAADILRAYRSGESSAPARSDTGRGSLGCLVLLACIGGCVYFSRGPKTPQSLPRTAPPASRPVRSTPITPEPKRVPEVTSPETSAPASETVRTEAPAETAPAEDTSEREAAAQLNLAKQYIKIKRQAKAAEILDAMINKYPDAPSTNEAKTLLRQSLAQ